LNNNKSDTKRHNLLLILTEADKMGAEQSTDSRSTVLDNPDSIEVTQPVLCTTHGAIDKAVVQSPKNKKEYGPEETDKLTAKLDEDYAKWMKDLEKQNEKFTRKVRDELIQKADEVYERFSYVEKQPICQDAQKSVLKCFELNKEQSLNCSEEVKYFTECVLKHQMQFNRNDYLPKPLNKDK